MTVLFYQRCLDKFFNILFEEIMLKLPEKRPNKEGIIIFNNKEIYWQYQLFLSDKPEYKNIKIYTNDYISMSSDFSFLDNKFIYLINDFYTGNEKDFRNLYEKLKKINGEDYLMPVAFACTISDEIKQQRKNNFENSFIKKFKYYCPITTPQYAEIITYLYKKNCSNCIPIFTNTAYIKELNKNNYEVIMTIEQFTTMIENKKWKCETFALKTDSKEEINYLNLHDNSLRIPENSCIDDLSITGTYYYDNDNKVHIVFTPNVVIKSIDYISLKQLFNNELCDKITGSKEEKENKLFMFFEYMLSTLISKRFLGYINENLNINLCISLDNVTDQLPTEYTEYLEKIISEEYKFDFNSIFLLNNGDNYKNYSNFEKTANLEKMLSEIYINIEEYDNINDLKTHIFHEFGYNENTVSLFNISLNILQRENLINKIQKYVKYSDYIETKFTYGNNRTSLIPFINKFFWFYMIITIDPYEIKIIKEKVLNRYDYIIDDLWRIFAKNHICDKTEFDYNAEYYKKLLEYDTNLITSYIYVLYDHRKGKLNDNETALCDCLERASPPKKLIR